MVGADLCVNPCFFILLIIKKISDSKRQQTLTVDYKRLINGFFLTGFASLRHETLKTKYYASKDIWMCPIRHRCHHGHH